MAELGPSTDENRSETMIFGLTNGAFRSFPPLRISLDVLAHKKNNIIGVQWFVAIATAYLLLFRNGQVSQEPLPYLLLALILGGTLFVQRLPDPVFDRALFCQALMIADTVFIAIAISLSKEGSWDILLIFFLGILIAAIGESFIQVVLTCFLLSLISVFILPARAESQFVADALLPQ